MAKTSTLEAEVITQPEVNKVPQADLVVRLANANEIVKRNVTYSVVAGMVPFPLVDLAGIAGVQLNMLNDLSKLYNVPFFKHKAKNILASLVGTIGTASLTSALGSLVKFIPVVGTVTGVVAMPVIAGASTYAVGKVFIQHFESGGTFLNFDPAETRAFYAEQFQEGKAFASAVSEPIKS